MGYHNLLTGEDLHAPSRVKILNSIDVNGSSVSLTPGDLIKLGSTSTFDVLNITSYAEENDTQVALVDTVIGGSDEGTVVLIGKVLNIPIEQTSAFKDGDFLKVGTDHRFEITKARDGIVASVLSRSPSNSNVMQVLFNPTSSVPHLEAAAVYLSNPAFSPRTATLSVPAGTDPASVKFILGWNSFGTGLDHNSGNGSFTFQTQDANNGIMGDIGSLNAMDITETGTYEISLDPYLSFENDLGHATGTFTFVSTVAGQEYLINSKVTLEILKGISLIEQDIFEHTTTASTATIPVFPLSHVEDFSTQWPTSDISLGSGFNTSSSYPKIVGLEAGDKVSLVMTITVAPTSTVLANTITLSYSANDTGDAADARSRQFTCGMRFKRLT